MKKTTPRISALIIAGNEEAVIADCLKSVNWADETIVLIDKENHDSTPEITKHQKAKLVVGPTFRGYQDRRNHIAKLASGDWFFYIDADERCPEELAKEIRETITKKSGYAAYNIPRANIRLTKPLFHGGWWPDYVLRLMRKDALKEWVNDLHEQPVIVGEIGTLKNHFIHLSHRGSLEHKFFTTLEYSKIEADWLLAANHPPMTLPRFISAMGREFWKRFVVFQGWRDGLEGLMEVVYQVFSVFITYARLWEYQNNQKTNK